MMLRTKLDAWKKLKQRAETHRFLMPTDTRLPLSTISFNDISVDFSGQFIDDATLQMLFELGDACQLKDKITQLMMGSHVNSSENKPALHVALRHFDTFEPLFVKGHNIFIDVFDVRAQMIAIANQIRKGEWFGYSGKAITDIVNIGIGGSQLGPQFCVNALVDFIDDTLQFHFISELDPDAFNQVVSKLNPETSLFIISSKSFETEETLYNAKQAVAWINQPNEIDLHFIAVTANERKARSYGFNNILAIWSWVGGRYSSCSAINLITCIAIGPDNFINMLRGAHEMDNHFRHADFSKNLPVLLALIGIWNNNFLHIPILLLLTYAHNLHLFVPHIQQLDMESNGKSQDVQARAVDYATGPIIWGGSGNQAQHSYFQLLCQGTHRVSADLISLEDRNHMDSNQMCLAHKEVLSRGFHELVDSNGCVLGNTPVNHMTLSKLTPNSIGALIALYEHKIFAQSVIWNINPFDQPGVESSKKLLQQLKHKQSVPVP